MRTWNLLSWQPSWIKIFREWSPLPLDKNLPTLHCVFVFSSWIKANAVMCYCLWEMAWWQVPTILKEQRDFFFSLLFVRRKKIENDSILMRNHKIICLFCVRIHLNLKFSAVLSVKRSQTWFHEPWWDKTTWNEGNMRTCWAMLTNPNEFISLLIFWI